MSDLYLDLGNKHQMIDLLLEYVEFLPREDALRERVDKMLDDLHEERVVSKESMAMLAKEVGKASWVPRMAVKRYLKTESGMEDEWRRVVAAVSNSTAHLLERFRYQTKDTSLDDVLNHEESSSAFHEKERYEIAEVRKHVLPAIWKEKEKDFKKIAEDLHEELLALETRISILRDLGFGTDAIDDVEIMNKITHLEDGLYFEGDDLSIEALDVEIAAYREQAGI